ncbi:MAG: hypothetical protein KatS3mg105_0365 [Gemmatales bacterium]|nr:MAG: hypothetical protein KatS3mg105_0365 [Gemmatales bacterium]
MTLGDLLEAVRSAYVKEFYRVLRDQRRTPNSSVYIEPIRRAADDTPWRAGALQLPYRMDLAVFVERRDWHVVEISTPRKVQFAPTGTDWTPNMRVTFQAFCWEKCPVRLHGRFEGEQWWPALDWFNHWFDEFETKAALQKDIKEVVHSISDPDVDSEFTYLTIDLGSAPVKCLEELLDSFEKMGTDLVEIGWQPD